MPTIGDFTTASFMISGVARFDGGRRGGRRGLTAEAGDAHDGGTAHRRLGAIVPVPSATDLQPAALRASISNPDSSCLRTSSEYFFELVEIH